MNMIGKSLMVATVMLSMGATDALANRTRTRTSNTSTSQTRQRQQQRQRTRVRTPRVQQNNSAVSARAKQTIQLTSAMLQNSISQNATPPFMLIPNKTNMIPFLTLLFARRAYAR